MLFVFSPIFVAVTKTIFDYSFVAPLRNKLNASAKCIYLKSSCVNWEKEACFVLPGNY